MNTKEKLLWTAIVIVLGGVGYLSYRYLTQTAEAPPAAPAETAAPPRTQEPAVENRPTSPDTADTGGPLPALAESDGEFATALAQLVGADKVGAQLVRENVIRNIVVTVDNLPRQKLTVERRPAKPTPGEAVTEGDADLGEVTTLSVQNYARYVPFVTAVQTADGKRLAALYFHWYPLFQKAYEDLGYPEKQFNDRLLFAIDDMLKAPEVQGPVRLVRPRVFFEYADPALESRSAGQKLLIRMGPENAAHLKAKLRELRAEVANYKR
ncbi:MAG: DUF3014 domain-containing protein [Steroidobacteraceae bacterium]